MRHLLATYPAPSPSTAIQYEIAVRHWERFFGDKPLSAVTPQDLASFAAKLSTSRSPATVNKIRRHLMALWAWDVETEGHGAIPRWKPLKEPRRAPRAFLVTEFQSILEAARARQGDILGIPAHGWWESFLLAIWYSGARVGAVLHVVWDDVLPDRFYVRAAYQKQSADQCFRIGEDCRAAIESIRGVPRDFVWPWPYKRKALYKHFRAICLEAGVPLDRNTGCLFHRIRKSTASYLRAAGGDATSQLGHSCAQVTRRYYDPRIVGAHDATAALPQL